MMYPSRRNKHLRYKLDHLPPHIDRLLLGLEDLFSAGRLIFAVNTQISLAFPPALCFNKTVICDEQGK